MAGDVIVVTGPPGAGKTTAARLVADALPLSVHLHADDFWDYIRGGRVPPHLPESKQQNELVMHILAETAVRYAEGGFDVVVDGIVGPWFIGGFRTLTDEHDLALHYFVVRPDEAVAFDRALKRTSPPLTDEEPVRKMYAEFSGLGPFEAFVLDNSGQEPEATARFVVACVADGSHRLTAGSDEG